MSEKVEYVSFKVDGEWLTQFFRTRFWDEKCGFDKAIKMIKDSLSQDITEEMCINILEGRKKLIGLNSFNYIDDNENIRPLTLYLKEQERKNKLNQIITNIETYPYNYIDEYACSTSRHWFNRYIGEYHGIGWWYEQLVYERGNSKDILENGCTWLFRPERTAEIIMNYTEKTALDYKEFAKVVFDDYESIIDGYRESKTPFNELKDYIQAIICRNRHYAICNHIKWSYLDEELFITNIHRENIEKQKLKEKENKIIEKAINTADNVLEKKALSKEEVENIMQEQKMKKAKEWANNPHMNKFFSNYGLGDIINALKSDLFDTSPSEIIAGWDGYVDRDGNFYRTKPIGTGWYNGTANCHEEWAIQYLEEKEISLEDKTIKHAKDYIIDELGWCDMSHLVLSGKEVYVNKSRKKGATKKQIDTLTKLFELNNDDVKRLYKLLND